MPTAAPFANFLPPLASPSPLRAEITRLTRLPEAQLLPGLLQAARLSPAERQKIAATARQLVEALRGKRRGSGVEGLVQEYALSSEEGVALMCLAEALLRIPDAATRDALIRDKIAGGDWAAHLGGTRSLFVNAATWGLVVTGKLTGTVNETGLTAALTRAVARAGEPLIRRGVAMAMRLMGEQFVTGQTIDEALTRARKLEAKGFAYSYDMLGEAATTAEDATRYLKDYQNAIEAIGKASAGRGIYAGPGISIKLSALHPRYSRAQYERVMAELLPVVKELCQRAKTYDIGLNIDAEEADRLELSLDLLEALALDPELAGWNGLGFVVQAYGKRCPAVLDWIIDLAARAGRRIMVRLVKGAYWDSEIKRAQVDGLSDFPVYTRKIHTDVAYIACAKKLLAARDHIFPQFATHNAQTLASIYHLAGPDFSVGDFEFQCLHGMGEPLYEEVVGSSALNRPCRIYAPVGTHETLLAYLVRRLLENGANSSFVNRIGDPAVPVEELIADPVEALLASPQPGSPHPGIALPTALFGSRQNSDGLDLSSVEVLTDLAKTLAEAALTPRHAAPDVAMAEATPIAILNPADPSDKVGEVLEAGLPEAIAALERASKAAPLWAATPPAQRADCLERAAELLQHRMSDLINLLIREAGKSTANAVSEVREAIDFLRYYAAEARKTFSTETRPLGTVLCISPWNFPLAIFSGQVAAALAAGNSVLAKPANSTPLIAAEAVRILKEAGVPAEALQLLPCPGSVVGELSKDPRISGVMFTGSTEVAKTIQRQLAGRLTDWGQPVPFIAETGGQNAMIVDSSALPEQVVGDVIASAFDSAGQRCSALRILCLQDEIADRVLTMLKGAMEELSVGPTTRLSSDIGPVISDPAKRTIEAHIAALEAQGCPVTRAPLGPEIEAARRQGQSDLFVAPTLIEIPSISLLKREVFGPVLHVIRYRRAELGQVIDAINATGYGLTFGLHTRIHETIAKVTGRVHAGNLYVNRNTIGAVVGSQPFGGFGLSGTGPKAGGPLYLRRLVQNPPPLASVAQPQAELTALIEWLREQSLPIPEVPHLSGAVLPLPGPVGERNELTLRPRGRVLLLAETRQMLLTQLCYVLAAGGTAVIDAPHLADVLADLPESLCKCVVFSEDWQSHGPISAALIEGSPDRVAALAQRIVELPGPIILAQAASREAPVYRAESLIEEQTLSVNTTAAGGNASLMTLA